MNINDDVHAQAAEMASALRSLKPTAQHRKKQLFSLLFPVIAELLDNEISQKSIIERLHSMGLKLHPTSFKELLAAETKLQSNRAEHGTGGASAIAADSGHAEVASE